MFFGVFGMTYAVWRIIAICVKKITGEWYRNRFFELLDSASPDIVMEGDERSLRENIKGMRRLALAHGKSERQILAWARKLRDKDAIWDENAEEEAEDDLNVAILDLTIPAAIAKTNDDDTKEDI